MSKVQGVDSPAKVVGVTQPTKVNGAAFTYSFYPRSIDYAAVFNDDDSDYLSWTPGVAASGNTKFYFSKWTKRGNILGAASYIFHSIVDANNGSLIGFNASDQIQVWVETGNVTKTDLVTTQVFRDPTNYFHLEVFYDSTPAAPDSTNVGIKINGVQVTAFATEDYPVQNDVHYFCQNGVLQTINATVAGASEFDGYSAEVIYLDQQGTGETGETKNGVWVPKESLSLTYGTNGFHLDFAASGDLGNDVSGNNNDFTVNGSPAQVTDTPTLNYYTVNPVAPLVTQTKPVFSEGNRKLTGTAAAHRYVLGEKIPDSGKWYFEYKATGWSSNEGIKVGWETTANTNISTGANIQQKLTNTADQALVYDEAALLFTDTTNASASTIHQVAIDMDNDKAWFGYDGNWYNATGGTTGDPAAGSNPTITGILPTSRLRFNTFAALVLEVNFGNPTFTITSGNTDDNGYGNFEYAPPTGFLALNSANIASSLTILDSIDQPAEAVYVNTRTGTGAEATISDVLFDVSAGAKVTTKSRSAATEWVTTDTSRGATKEINFDDRVKESTVAQGHKSYTSTGYVLGTDANYNNNTVTFLDWVLREGAAYGFDIVTYEGNGANRTIAHTLGIVPTMMWSFHLTDDVQDHEVYHSLCASDPETDEAQLQDSGAFADVATVWNDTAPTSSVFSLGTNGNVNENLKNFVMYLFADIPGLCKAFAYTGNGNADGPYIPLGFTSSVMFIKSVGAVGWILKARKDSPTDYNEYDRYFFLDTNAAEGVAPGTTMVDFLSQGVKVRTTGGGLNTNAQLYVGMAWAEQFGAYSNGR